MPQYPAVIQLSDLDGDNGFRLDGESNDGQSGFSVASAGDVNGDGFADVIIGAWHTSAGFATSGASYVVFGGPGGTAPSIDLSSLNGSAGFRIGGAGTDDFSGWSVSSAGDVNGDGVSDLIVGARAADANGYDAGAAYVVFGNTSGFAGHFSLSTLDGTNGFRLVGAAAGDSAGASVHSAGDVNGDGFDDVIVGANYAGPNGKYSGASYVVFGKASGFAADIQLSELNGTDGFKLSGEAAYDQSSRSGAGAGDINGDGFADLIVGAQGASGDVSGTGAAYVVFGKAAGFAANIDLSGLNGTDGFKISGESGSALTGVSVASAGDVNGDGVADLIVGALNPASAGAAYVVFGQASGFGPVLHLADLDGTTGFKIGGVMSSDYTGCSVASAGDVNGDGYDDLIIGAERSYLNGARSGAAYVVFGKASGFAADLDLSSLDGTQGFRIDGVGADDQAGISVSGAGDLNGDGLDDLIVGANYADPNGPDRGSSYVIYGRLPDAAVVRTGTAADQSLAGGDFNDTLSGLGGSDRLSGNGGADNLSGGKGADVLQGGGGNDSLDGGKGVDTASYLTATSFVVVDLGAGGPQNTLGAGADTLVSIENLSGSAYDDILNGDGGRNTLDGGVGDDVLQGKGGADILIGGVGLDTASYAAAASGVRVSLALKGFQNTTSEGKDKLVDIENLTGSGFDDQLTGDHAANVLYGGGGRDVLTGGNGQDIFFFHALSDSSTAAPDLITDFEPGDVIHLQAIDAKSGVAGNQAFHLGATQNHAGDIVATYAAGPDRTTLSLYVDGDAVADAAIQLSGNHTDLSSEDFVL